MPAIPPEIQARREIEDLAVRLGAERGDLANRTMHNTWEIMELLRKPGHGLIPLDQLANLLGVSRQTLYRWREIAHQIPDGTPVAVWLSQTDDDGNYIHNYG